MADGGVLWVANVVSQEKQQATHSGARFFFVVFTLPGVQATVNSMNGLPQSYHRTQVTTPWCLCHLCGMAAILLCVGATRRVLCL